MRGLLVALVAALAFAVVPSVAAAQVCPPFGGGMSFPDIQGPEDPEEFCWEVNLAEDQELRQIDETHAAVYYTEPEHLAFGITAGLAHDAEGTAVPTSIEVVQPNEIVLTVHHRAGNAAAGGTAFDYPVSAGVGWEGGFETVEIKGPPDESELKPKPPLPVEESPYPHCRVPRLLGKSFKAAQRALWKGHCRVGPVHGNYSGTKVVRQYQPPGAVLPLRTQVGLELR